MEDRQRDWLGPLLTLVWVGVTEATLWTLPQPVSVIAILLGLTAVAYAGLRGGFAPGILSAAILAVYTLHYVAGPRGGFQLDRAGLQGGAIMLAIGSAMAATMALLRRRERRLLVAVESNARDLAIRNRELTEANRTLEAFGYAVSHDLREPVRGIQNYLEAAQEEYGTEEGRAFLRRALDANVRLTRLLTGLLSYSRASSYAVRLVPVDVGAVLAADTCRTHYEALLKDRGVDLDVAPGIPPVLADEVVLGQLLGNAVLNALRHAGPRPRVRVRAREDAPEGCVRVAVEDDGPGFPPDVLGGFETADAGGATGLRGRFGLTIMRRAANRLGAQLRLENLPEGGAAVVVDLQKAEEKEKPAANGR
ncbi:MAG TPA: HAMP domain-containing sensor histidine kinase [Candidatus Thermoplasmatota archaeon]|nr:HAMP domain-containing sensor histidine kinase [Candidatus Thermoplasmatota archaeon]